MAKESFANKKYNKTLAALWETKTGSYMSMPVDAQVFDAIQGVEKGTKLVIKILDPESRKTDKSPHAYLELISKEDVAAYAANRGNRGATAPAAAANDDI